MRHVVRVLRLILRGGRPGDGPSRRGAAPRSALHLLWLGCVAVLGTGAVAQGAVSPVVSVDGGALRGERLADRVAFRGVPFAAPPVGPLRWRAPAPVRGWKGVREATRSAPSCAQLDDGWNRDNAAGSVEDCLYLDVATPTLTPERPMPVMVWIHGGSNKAGGAAGTVSTSMIRRGIVVVAIQYRLGPLGFLTHPALSAESPVRGSGNYGLMDQQAALRWVRRNIARFGGDPAQVTIAGESAGAMDVALHQLAPASRGLFRAAIQESGTASFGHPARTVAQGETIGEALVAEAGHPRATAAVLRAIPAADLLQASRKIEGSGRFDPGILWIQAQVDGTVITEPPAATLAGKRGALVPLLIGSNAREIDFFNTPAGARAALPGNWGANAGRVATLYGLDRPTPPADDPVRGPVALQVATDAVFTCPTRFNADARVAAGVPVWRYDFTYQPVGGPQLSHASELRYMFGNAGEDGIPADAPRLQAYWANFIRSSDPNGKGLVRWNAYAPNRSYLRFGAGQAEPGGGLRDDICRDWNRP